MGLCQNGIYTFRKKFNVVSSFLWKKKIIFSELVYQNQNQNLYIYSDSDSDSIYRLCFCGYFTFVFFFMVDLASSQVLKQINRRKTTINKTVCVLGDQCDDRMSSAQLGNASALVKPASWLISPDYCLSILSALLTSPSTTPSPHHLPSLLTVWSAGTVYCRHQKWLRVFFSEILLKTWFQTGVPMVVFLFSEITTHWIVCSI